MYKIEINSSFYSESFIEAIAQVFCEEKFKELISVNLHFFSPCKQVFYSYLRFSKKTNKQSNLLEVGKMDELHLKSWNVFVVSYFFS